MFFVVIILEFFRDVMEETDNRDQSGWYIYRRALGLFWGFVGLFFLASVLLLCYVQTENLCAGDTTCERYAKTNYRQIHQAQLEAIEMEMSMEQYVKRRYSIMAVDDTTNPTGARCGTFYGMFCNTRVRP